MSEDKRVLDSGVVGALARVVTVACFGAGAIAAVVTQQLVLAGAAFLAGHTILAATAMLADRRRRGVGLSLSGVGWLSLSIGLAARADASVGAPATPALVVGGLLVTLGTALVVGESGDSGGKKIDEPAR